MFIRKVDIPRIQSPIDSENNFIQDVLSQTENNVQQKSPKLSTNVPSYTKPKFNGNQIPSNMSFLDKITNLKQNEIQKSSQQSANNLNIQNNNKKIHDKQQTNSKPEFQALSKTLERTFVTQQAKDINKPFETQKKLSDFFNLDDPHENQKKPQLIQAPKFMYKKTESSYHFWVEEFYIPLQLQRLSYFQEISQIMKATGLILWRLTYFNEKYETKIYPDRFKMYLCYHQVVEQERVKIYFKTLLEDLHKRLQSFSPNHPQIQPTIASSRFKKVLKKFSILKLTRQSEEEKILKKRIVMRVGPVIKKIQDQLITYCQKRVISDKVACFYPINIKNHQTKSDYIDPLEKIMKASITISNKKNDMSNNVKKFLQKQDRKATLMKLGYKPTDETKRQSMRQKIFGKPGFSPTNSVSPPPVAIRSTPKKRNNSNDIKNSFFEIANQHNNKGQFEQFSGSMQNNQNMAEKNVLDQYKAVINHLSLFNAQFHIFEQNRKYQNRQKQIRLEQQRNSHINNVTPNNYATTYEILQQKLNEAIRKNDYEEINKILELMERLKKMPNQGNGQN